MSSFPPAAVTQTTTATARAGRGPTTGDPFDIPVLRPGAGGPAERFAGRFATGHPVRVFFASVVLGFVVVAALSIGIGAIVKHLVLPAAGIGSGDESVNVWLAAHRDPTRTDVSLVGSTIGGAPLLPDPRRPDRDRPGGHAPLAPRRVLRLRARGRVRALPRHDARRPSRPAGRRAARPSAGGRELSVGAHRRLGRRLLRPRPAADVAVHERARARPRLGRGRPR